MLSETPSLPEASGDVVRPPVRLGLALSGGGFRATLFHLGVLQRLAEMDLLRHVSVLSAVSGGSILAAHYMLLLKHELESRPARRLLKSEYEALVRRLGEEIRQGIQSQPRNLLLLSPWRIARMLYLGFTPLRTSMSEQMAQLYQRLFYQAGTRRLSSADPKAVERGMRLPDMKVDPEAVKDAGGIRRYNANPLIDRVPELVLNAATLNTASRFTFNFVEIGDEVLGHIRFDELELLKTYRRVLKAWERGVRHGAGAGPALQGAIDEARAAGSRPLVAIDGASRFERRRCLASHLQWWNDANADRGRPVVAPRLAAGAPHEPRALRASGAPAVEGESPSVATTELYRNADFGRRFLEAPLGQLRSAKVAAWYLLHRPVRERGVDGEPRAALQAIETPDQERARAERRDQFWSAIREIDKEIRRKIGPPTPLPVPIPEGEWDWFEFVLELYYFRVAKELKGTGLHDLRLPLAVQASANFPPVFGGLRLRGIFERSKIKALQLSDGGLNDNNGVEALFDARCTFIIASDAGPQPTPKSTVTWSRLGMMSQILMNQLPIVRRLVMRTLREQERVHHALATAESLVLGPGGTEELRALWQRYPLEGYAFFFLDSKLTDGVDDDASPTPLPEHPLAREIANLRTDLDGFSELEQGALCYQGYQYCDRFVRKHLWKKLAGRGVISGSPPPLTDFLLLPRSVEEFAHQRRVLHAGRALLCRAWRVGGWYRAGWVLATLMCAGLFALVGVGTLSAWVALVDLLRKATDPIGWPLVGVTLLVALAGIPLALATVGVWLWTDGALALGAARPQPPRAGTR